METIILALTFILICLQSRLIPRSLILSEVHCFSSSTKTKEDPEGVSVLKPNQQHYCLKFSILVVRLAFMNREERKRRFNEAIVEMLFPPPPKDESPASPPEEEANPVQASIEGFGSDALPDTLDVYENASTSTEEEQESDSPKLTRAQRKKIRKRKLKEEALRRGKLIGPLLPTDQHADHPPAVRSNASESQENCGPDKPGPQTSKKVNQRRKAKRMAKVKQNSSDAENLNRHSASEPSVDLKEDH
ncbi:pre-mRNA-splicing ATP-dependent RNA helicase prp28 [Neltuma alba]|uniref:pre-mRNA-splicing ATP-dependent RNA helicase prp28 n=1 Tax=Neltuma alba TaxID=207710 RepID=UPI0010A4D079|nr:pre-mRNA-splicing ATP-dependent RNA helicase prp28 [Prosopis alba]